MTAMNGLVHMQKLSLALLAMEPKGDGDAIGLVMDSAQWEDFKREAGETFEHGGKTIVVSAKSITAGMLHVTGAVVA